MTSRHVAVCLFVCVATLLTCSPPATAQTSDWAVCASEGGTCAFSGTQEVRYGANGVYFYKTLTNGTACTNSVFGDPAYGAGKQCATRTADFTVCASEGGTCAFSGTQEVRYGANGSYFYKTLTGGTACTNGVFGDPAPSTVKQCATPSAWTFCASEGGSCAFSGTQQVRYGANGSYFYETLTGGTACTNTVFGDPAPGIRKQCETTTTATSWTFCASEGGTCAFTGAQQVRFGANGSYFYKTLTGGAACTNSVFGDPSPGTKKQCDVAGTASIAPPSLAPPPATTYGPTPSITCPGGAADIWPGSFIPSIVSVHPAGTTYCVRAGVHSLTSAITPKRGDTFVGEYGAILDGSGWATSDTTQAAFRAHNQDIDYVTIRNLVIRNMPQRGIHAYYYLSDHWTIEYNEIASSKNIGLVFPGDSLIRGNYIHHNTYSGYQGPYAHNSTLDGNEIAYNGWEQKVMESDNVTFRNNFVHHNVGAGIWFDSDNTGVLVEGNRVEDNGHVGIWIEISNGITIRNNTIRRSADTGVFISTSKNAQIYNNTIDSNFRGITYFVNCPSVGGGTNSWDLANNSAYDNTVTVGTRSGAFASLFSYGSCTASQAAPYLNGSKNLTFSRNTYYVSSPTTGQFWYWSGSKYWNEWQGVPQDLTGAVSQ